MTDLITLLQAWVPTQRWFAGGDGPARLRLLGSYSLADPAHDLGVRFITVAILLDEDSPARTVYQVPLVIRAVDGAIDARGYIGTYTDAQGAAAVVDGPHDGAFVRALLDLIRRERTATGPGGASDAIAYGQPMPAVRVGTYTRSHVLQGEQSNSSVVIETVDDAGRPAAPLIMKVFRTLGDGENPDATLQTALAAAGSLRVPPALGQVAGEWPDPRTASGRASSHLVFAQEYLAGVEDAWRVALRSAESGDDFTEQAYTLGQAIAETHATLRRVMPVVPAGGDEIAAALRGMRDRFVQAAESVPRLAELAAGAERVFADAESAPWPVLQRIHGDLHLGQVLAVPERGWVLLDFEGEPLRPMAERNAPDAAVRDVAGMLRSFDYVAGALSVEAGRRTAADWAQDARAAFLRGYADGPDRGAAASHVPPDEVVPAPATADDVDPGANARGDAADARGDDDAANTAPDPRVLRAYELDKAVYEARYEAAYRPAWLSVPLDGIERLLAK